MDCPTCETKNPERAKYCLECGQRMPASRTVSSPDRTGFRRRGPVPKAPVREEGERRPAIILCAEIVGLPTAAESAGPGDLRDRMASVFRRLESVLDAHGAVLDRFQGNGLTAVFGVPEPREDDGLRAARCAIALQEGLEAALAELRAAEEGRRPGTRARARPAGRSRRKSKVPPLQLRAAIHAGEILWRKSGLRGVGGAGGDALTVAQSLLAVAEPSALVLSRAVQRPLQAHFRFRALAPLHLRGRERFVQAFHLLGEQRTPAHWLTPFVGRELTLARLLEQFHLAADRCHPRFVLIEGGAGLGKSRLVYELRQQLVDLPQPVTVLQGRCLPHSVVPFGPFGEMLRARLGLEPDLPVETAMERLKTICGRVFPGDPLAPHYVGLILGLRPTASPLTFMDVRDALAGAHYTLKRLLEGFAGGRVPAGRTLLREAVEYVYRVESGARGQPPAEPPAPVAPRSGPAAELLDVSTPLVVVLEDFQWTDPNSLEFIRYLTQTPFHGPILVVAVGRREGVVDDLLKGKRAGSERWFALHIEALHVTAAARLVTAMCRGRVLSAGVLERLLGLAAGSPFHVEEIMKWLVDQRALDLDAPAADLPLPGSLDEVLLARIDALAPPVREVLVCASVMGRLFWRSAVESALGRPVADDLRALESRGLVFELGDLPAPAGGPQHVFKNGLLREVAFRGLTPEARRATHERLWEFFSRLEARLVAEHPRLRLLAAHHAVESEQPFAAFRLYVQAGDQARSARSDLEALDSYGKALALTEPSGPFPPEWETERAAVLEKHALTQTDLRQFEDAESELRRAMAVADGPEDRARLEGHIGALYWAQGKIASAIRHYRAALRHAGRRASPLTTRLELDLAEALTEGREETEEAGRRAKHVLATAKAHRWPDLQARAAQILGQLAWIHGRPDEAVRHIAKVQKHHEKQEDPVAECAALHLLGRVHLAQGNVKKAMDAFRKHLELGERYGYEHQVEDACLEIGDLERLQGRFDPARVSAERAAGIALELGEPRGVARASLLLARIYREMGDPDTARQLAESGLSLFETVQDPTGTGECRGEFARLHHLAGEAVAAEAHARAWLAAAERSRDPRQVAPAASVLGAVLHAYGDRAAGLRELERAAKTCDQLKDVPCWTQCAWMLARALVDEGRLGPALDLAKNASFAALNLELTTELCRIQSLLGEIYLDNGLLPEAAHSARKSLSQLGAYEACPARVPALRVLGRALRRSGREEEGMFRLRESERLAVRLGMKPEAERCAQAIAEPATAKPAAADPAAESATDPTASPAQARPEPPAAARFPTPKPKAQ